MRLNLFVFLLLFLTSAQVVLAQKNQANISGKVLDENEHPLAHVSISILGKDIGAYTSDSGYFSLSVVAGRPFALIFSYTGYKVQQRNFNLAFNEKESITIVLQPTQNVLQDVTVRDNRPRTEAGRIDINAAAALVNPSPLGNIESLIKIFTGSNNELTSQYNVRGGSYDENLIYVNDFEVFRPYLVRSGQQEGLSFINPEMTANVKFYNGGFPGKVWR